MAVNVPCTHWLSGRASHEAGLEPTLCHCVAGFLRTRPGPDRDGTAGGNLGVCDILSALQWVRHNVAAFGGDPGRVTVLGHDTGAALVNLLLISRAAKGKPHGDKKYVWNWACLAVSL